MDIDDQKKVELILKYLTGDISDNQRTELYEWISLNPENESLLFRMKDIYEAGNWENIKKEANTLAEWKTLSEKISSTAFIKQSKPPRSIFVTKALSLTKYAALVIAGMSLMYFVQQQIIQKNKPISIETTKIITGKSERTQTILPDGTRVWVNSCSMISYDSNYGKENRQINLLGEAYFEVKKDAKRPFLVKTSGVTVKALGTAFNVTNYSNDSEISAVLVEGSVSFSHKNNTKEIILTPGQRASYSTKNQHLTIKNVDAELYTKWPKGEYKFDQLSFEEIAKRLERNYNMTFVFLNQKMKDRTFTGSFKNYESLDQILRVIKTNTKLNYSIEKDTIFIK